MANILLYFIAVSVALNFCVCDQVPELNQNDLLTVLAKHQNVLLLFYDYHCKEKCLDNLKEFDDASQEFKQQKDQIHLVRIDSYHGFNLATELQVTDYPKILYFRRHIKTPTPFVGQFSAAYIQNWVYREAGRIFVELYTVHEVQHYIEKSKQIPVVIFYGEFEDDQQLHVFRRESQHFPEIIFAYTLNLEVREEQELSQDTKVILYKKFDEMIVHYDSKSINIQREKFTSENFEMFLKVEGSPAFMDFDRDAIRVVYEQGSLALIVFLDETKQSQQVFAMVESISHSYKYKMKFQYCFKANLFYPYLSQYLGINVNKLPQVVVTNPRGESTSFILDKDITINNLKEFIQDFLAGKLQRVYKSEDVSDETNHQTITKIVGSTFQKMVLQDERDVLVFFYTSQCKSCYKTLDSLSTLAELLRDEQQLSIGSLDLMKNDVAGLSIKQVPVMMLWPGDSKLKPIEYVGDYSSQSILTFLKNSLSFRISV